MGEYSFQRHERLRGPDFKRTQRQGRRCVGKVLILWAFQRKDQPPRRARLGILVGRRHGGAVQRNLFKRRIREAFRLNKPWPRGWDLVVGPKTAAASGKPKRSPVAAAAPSDKLGRPRAAAAPSDKLGRISGSAAPGGARSASSLRQAAAILFPPAFDPLQADLLDTARRIGVLRKGNDGLSIG